MKMIANMVTKELKTLSGESKNFCISSTSSYQASKFKNEQNAMSKKLSNNSLSVANRTVL